MKTKLKKLKLVALLMFILGLSAFAQEPTISGTHEKDKLVKNKNWKMVDNLSDEFDGNELDPNKWDTRSIIPGKHHWLGRWPGLFEAENIHVMDGLLYMESKRFNGTKTDSKGIRSDWTHGGAIIRSHAALVPGQYIECEMRTTQTIFSGTFWMQTNHLKGCDEVPVKELDITESIGRRSYETKDPYQNWYNSAAKKFNSRMNANARQRQSSCLSAINRDGSYGNINPSGDYHIYGFYWESPTKLHFYLNGEYQGSITPSIPFDDPMDMILATEIYDFNIPTGDDEKDGFKLANGEPRPLSGRSTKYRWIRVWEVNNNNIETVNCGQIPATIQSKTSYTFNVPYKSNAKRDIALEFWVNGVWKKNAKATVNAGSRTASVTIDLNAAPAIGASCLVKAAIRPVGKDWSHNIAICEKTVTVAAAPTRLISVQAENIKATGGTYNDGTVPYGSQKAGNIINYVNKGDWMDYQINIPTAGAYEVTYYISSPITGSTIKFGQGSSVWNTTTVPNNGSWSNYQALKASSTLNFTAQAHTIRLSAGVKDWTWNLDKFTLKRIGAMKSVGEISEVHSTTPSLRLHPNPVNQELNISFSDKVEDNAQIFIYNSAGALVIIKKLSNSELLLDVSRLSGGVYIAKILNGGYVLNKKFIKE